MGNLGSRQSRGYNLTPTRFPKHFQRPSTSSAWQQHSRWPHELLRDGPRNFSNISRPKKNSQIPIRSIIKLTSDSQRICCRITQEVQQRWAQDINLASNLSSLAVVGCSGTSLIHGGPTVYQTWLWSVKAWTQDLWGCTLVSGTKTRAAVPLIHMGWKVDPPCIRHVLAHQTDTWSDKDRGNLKAR